ncbi:MAG: hypothetical protein D6732_04130 [Methanobacteriota archaeon]|nr:MAG: hypothetical protein D6732_04130 [Euryarchaeota archaeon]
MLFEKILNVWRRERVEEDLVPLEPNFFEKVQTYLKHLEMMATSDEDELARKIFNRRFQRLNFIINDLTKLRMEKHFYEIIAGKPRPKKLTSEEEMFRDKLNHLIRVHQDSILGITALKEEPFEGEDEEKYEFCIFLEDEPNEIVGADLFTYGPFKKGDVVLMPIENIRNFVRRSKVKQLNLKI